MNKKFDAVLFDLDGTLVDTAPDLVATLDAIIAEEKSKPISYEEARPYVSHGAKGLLNIGLGIESDHPNYSELRQRFLDKYAEIGYANSRLFEGIETLLDKLDSQGTPWGIVTNKPQRFTSPLLQSLALADRSAVSVSGDTYEKAKPSPLPIIKACQTIKVDPKRTIYVGDAERDIQAGKNANCFTVAVGFGYIPADENMYDWKADIEVNTTEELTQTLVTLLLPHSV